MIFLHTSEIDSKMDTILGLPERQNYSGVLSSLSDPEASSFVAVLSSFAFFLEVAFLSVAPQISQVPLIFFRLPQIEQYLYAFSFDILYSIFVIDLFLDCVFGLINGVTCTI